MEDYKYGNQIIRSYINAEDMIYDVDELENDPKFMRKVIEYTKDKNMYNLCSDEVKKDYFFTRFMIETFSKDFNLIIEVANNFIDGRKNTDVDVLAISILVCNFVPKNILDKSDETTNFAVKKLVEANILYLMEDVFSNIKFKDLDSKSLRDTKNGFNYFMHEYNGNDIILNYFAKKELVKIFNYGDDMHAFYHNIVRNKDSVSEDNINMFFIKYIETKDPYLSDYITTNLHLIDEYKKHLIYSLDNWDKYNEEMDNEKFDLIYKLFDEENYILSFHTNDSYIYHAAKKVGLGSRYEDYIKRFKELYGFQFELEELNEEKFNFDEKRAISFLVKNLEELFRKAGIDEEKYDGYIKSMKMKNKKPGKVIKLTNKKCHK